jgi:SNF2 family DNA or RNA helicase
LHDYQARTLSWLYQVESNREERALSFTCPEYMPSRDVGGDANILWICLVGVKNDNGNSIFYSLLESAFFEYSADEPRKVKFIKYRVPVNGVALCDNPGSGKTIVSLALIYSKPFVSVKGLGFDIPSFVPSRATLIISPLHLVEQWQTEALRCMPDASIVLIPVISYFLMDRI